MSGNDLFPLISIVIDEMKTLTDVITANQQKLEALQEALQAIRAEQNAFADRIQAALSIKGIIIRTGMLPLRLIRKIGRAVLNLLKRSVESLTTVFGKCFSMMTRFVKKSKTYVWKPASAEEIIFGDIFQQNAWGSEESHSGTGSTLSETNVIRAELPRIVEKYGIQTFLDLPCGDFHWMCRVDLGVKRYIGGDIVKDLIAENAKKFSGAGREFKQLNLLTSRLPKADMIFCRDCLVHLSFEDVQRAMENLHRSGIKYLLATTFTGRSENGVIPTGHWTPYNLQAAPFCFPEPIETINENCRTFYPDYTDKSLGLWRIEDLPQTLLFASDRKAA